MIADVADIDQIIVGQRILDTGHPLLHVWRMTDWINYRIESKAHIRQTAQRVSGRQNFSMRKCALARYCCRAIAAGQTREAIASDAQLEPAAEIHWLRPNGKPLSKYGWTG